MNSLPLKIWIWTKITVFGLLALYVLVFVIKNNDNDAEFWFWFGREWQLPVLILSAASFVAGIIAAVLVRTTLKTVRQIRDVRERSRTERLEREVTDMRSKAAMLKTRETTAAPSDTSA